MELTNENQDITSGKSSEEEAKKGLRVVVNDPDGIYHVATRFDWDENDGMLIQKDDMNDDFCSTLTTRVEYDMPSSPGDPNEFHFSSAISSRGKNASISKFKKGYVTDEEMRRLVGILEGAFGEAEILDDEERRTLEFRLEGSVFQLDLGFRDAKTKVEWEKRRAEESKMMIKQRFRPKPVTEYNSYTLLRSLDHPSRPGLSPQENFFENLKVYASAYERVLSGLYHIHGVSEPDRVLEFAYRPLSGEHLQVVK